MSLSRQKVTGSNAHEKTVASARSINTEDEAEGQAQKWEGAICQ